MNINKSWIWDIAIVMVCYAVLAYLCQAVLPKKYRYLQERLASLVMWASVGIAIIWMLAKRNTIGIIMESLGLSRIEIPFLQVMIRQVGGMFMRLSVNMALGLFIVVYIIFKRVWLLWRKRVFEKNALQGNGVCGAYVYHRMAGKYVLRPEYVQQRKFYQILFLAAGLLFGLTKCVLDHTGSGMELFVMAAALSFYLWERLAYFSGCTLEEDVGRHKKEKKESLALQELIPLLKEKGKPYVIHVYMQEKADTSMETSSSELEERLMEIQLSKNYKKRCMGYAWHQTIKGRSEIRREFMEAALLLAERQSLYIAHSFYKEIGAYLFPFFELELLDNKKLLVLYSGQEDEELSNWLEAGLSGKVGKLALWMAGHGQEIGNADIGIVPLRYLTEAVEATDSHGFFLQISAVLFVNPSRLIASHPIAVLKLLARLHPDRREQTYIVCDRNGIGMADWLSHACKTEFSIINAVNNGKEHLSAIIDMDTAILSGNEKQELPEWETAKLLFQKTKESIQWRCDRLIPAQDMLALQGRYDGNRQDSERESFFDEKETRKVFAEIAEDNCYHVAEVIRQGYMTGVTAVCAPHYMLRGYILFCMETGRTVNVSQILPDFINSERNMAIAVCGRLLSGGVEWLELKELAEYYGADVQKGLTWLLGSLNRTLAEALGLDCVWLTEDMMSQKENGERRAVISTEEGRQQLRRWYRENIDFAVYKREGSEEVLPELTVGCHVFQQYLPGQFLTIEGRYYRVEDIFLQQGRRAIRLKRSADSCDIRQYYRQLRKTIFEEDRKQQAECLFQHGEVMVELCCGDLRVQTEGYLCSRRFFDVRRANYRRVTTVPDRIYRKKKLIKISAQNQNCMWIGILLKEILYTLFPHSWQLLSVAVGERWWKEELRGHVDVLVSSGTKEDRDIIYVIEDSPMDLGLVEAIGNHFERIRSMINAYVAWGNMEGKEEVREYFGDELLDKLRLTGIC